MKNIRKYRLALTFLVILSIGCKKDDTPELKTCILFSVDLDIQKFNPFYREAYISAYTSDGKLINYGSLTDSARWDLKGECKEDKIDILYFEIRNGDVLFIDHIKNVNIGQTFVDTKRFEIRSTQDIRITLKVEDFGNHNGNSTSLKLFETVPRQFVRGYPYTGEFDWNQIDEGYTYKNSYINLDPRYQGIELLIFERNSNVPYICYLDIPASDLKTGDTITLNKNDFESGILKTIQVNSPDNDFDNIFLYTYNSIDGKEDLITSFDQVIPNISGEKSINYIMSDILPINYWVFKYFCSSSGSSSYTISSNKEIPSAIEIKKLTGHNITKSGRQFSYIHSNIFSDKSLTRSTIQFSKGECNSFLYSLHFDSIETVRNSIITPFNIPTEILNKYIRFKETDSLEWEAYRYSHVYTNVQRNSPLEYLKNSVLKWSETNSSNDEYTYEEFIIEL